jgi:hypothetical protein
MEPLVREISRKVCTCLRSLRTVLVVRPPAQPPRQLSIKGTMQAVESFTPAMMATESCDVLYNAFMVTVSSHRVGNRPGRLEPRLKKRRPTWNTYLTKPRSQTRRKLAKDARASIR